VRIDVHQHVRTERLPGRGARELIAAYDAGVAGLPEVFGSCGAIALGEPDPDAV
jgi:hypothetical protein